MQRCLQKMPNFCCLTLSLYCISAVLHRNITFREMVDQRRKVYLSSHFKREKRLIAESIVAEVKDLDPPGRFLARDDKSGFWFVISEDRAREKTSQALRENSKKMKEEIERDVMKKRGKSLGQPPVSHHYHHGQHLYAYGVDASPPEGQPAYAGWGYPVYFDGYGHGTAHPCASPPLTGPAPVFLGGYASAHPHHYGFPYPMSYTVANHQQQQPEQRGNANGDIHCGCPYAQQHYHTEDDPIRRQRDVLEPQQQQTMNSSLLWNSGEQGKPVVGEGVPRNVSLSPVVDEQQNAHMDYPYSPSLPTNIYHDNHVHQKSSTSNKQMASLQCQFDQSDNMVKYAPAISQTPRTHHLNAEMYARYGCPPSPASEPISPHTRMRRRNSNQSNQSNTTTDGYFAALDQLTAVGYDGSNIDGSNEQLPVSPSMASLMANAPPQSPRAILKPFRGFV